MVAKRSFTAVLFDVDDTLYDRHKAQGQVLQKTVSFFPELFAGLSEVDIVNAFHKSDHDTSNHYYSLATIRKTRTVRWRKFLENLHLPNDFAEKLTDFYVETYRCVDASISDALPVVQACRKKFRIGIVSNAFPDVQYYKLEAIGLRDLFECITLSEEIGVRKPNPAIFLKACADLQVIPKNSLYVGDSYANDIVGSHAAGLASCWFNPGNLPLPVGGDVPDYVVTSLREVLEIVGCDQPAYE